MSTQALDKRITFGMFLKSIGQKLQGIMAKSISAEEKLQLITEEMEKDVASKRATARSIRAKMVALADPDTKELEPLEKLRAKRAKLVTLGAEAVKNNDLVRANKIANEIKALESPLASLEATYSTLVSSYEIALENYKTSQASYEHVKNNGSTLLFAIKAHQEALQLRDNARSDSGKGSDTSFLNDLERELSKASAELKSDKEIDREVEGANMSVLDETPDNEAILNEFKSAVK